MAKKDKRDFLSRTKVISNVEIGDKVYNLEALNEEQKQVVSNHLMKQFIESQYPEVKVIIDNDRLKNAFPDAGL